MSSAQCRPISRESGQHLVYSPTPESGHLGGGTGAGAVWTANNGGEVDSSGEEQVQGGEGSKHASKVEGMWTDQKKKHINHPIYYLGIFKK